MNVETALINGVAVDCENLIIKNKKEEKSKWQEKGERGNKKNRQEEIKSFKVRELRAGTNC